MNVVCLTYKEEKLEECVGCILYRLGGGEESSRQWTLTNGPGGGDGEIAATSHLPPRG